MKCLQHAQNKTNKKKIFLHKSLIGSTTSLAFLQKHARGHITGSPSNPSHEIKDSFDILLQLNHGLWFSEARV